MSIKCFEFPGKTGVIPGSDLYRACGKRLLDIGLIVLAAPFVVPLVGVFALLVALDGGKPFYSQNRIGRNGRVFRIWKLRTMVRDADTRLAELLRGNPALKREWDSTQKLANDPRITALGGFLRSTSMDELPQLFNVLVGDMSLVGPRPMMASQRAMYPGKDYYDLLPGITGPWQVSARNLSAFADRAGYDTRYNRNLSFAKDLRILAATVKVVGSRTGC